MGKCATEVIQSDGSYRTAPSTATALAASTRTPLLHCKYEGHVLPFFKVVISKILKLSCVILNQLYKMVSRKSSHGQL